MTTECTEATTNAVRHPVHFVTHRKIKSVQVCVRGEIADAPAVATDRMIQIADGFWNIRGSFKVGGLLEIGTQVSLARLHTGGFVILDSYTLTGDVLSEVMRLTDNGRAVEAVLNLHPFHTVHVQRMADQFPDARWYGTTRHIDRFPGLRWEPECTEDPAMHALFREDFDFSVPRGVDFIPRNENLHFASVLAIHKPSRTLHVDDTLTWISLPLVKRLVFHPTLQAVLQRRVGAADEFREWAEKLVADCAHVDHICTAHAQALPPQAESELTVAQRVRRALQSVDRTVSAHKRRFG